MHNSYEEVSWLTSLRISLLLLFECRNLLSIDFVCCNEC